MLVTASVTTGLLIVDTWSCSPECVDSRKKTLTSNELFSMNLDLLRYCYANGNSIGTLRYPDSESITATIPPTQGEMA